MQKALAPLVSAAVALCRLGTLAAFALLVGVVALQVLGRFPGFIAPPWTEELARFGLVYLVAFSCGIALLRGEMVNVDMFVTPLPPALRNAIERVVDVIVIAFSVLILPAAWDYVAGSIGERGRSINVPMVAVYVVMLIIPFSLAFFSVMRLLGCHPKPPPAHGETL